jgi:hypothetical protein
MSRAYTNTKRKLAELEVKKNISPYFWRKWEAANKKLRKLEQQMTGQQQQIFNHQ